MRTKHVLWALRLSAPSAMALFACGDDETTTSGAGGAGGSTTNTTTVTSASTSATGATTSASTSSATTSSATTGSVSSTGTDATASASTSTGMGSANLDACPGSSITLVPEDNVLLSGSTAGLTSDFDLFCAVGSTAPDAVYQIEVAGACSLTATVTGTNGLNPALSLRYEQCATESAGVQCVASDKAILLHQEPTTLWAIVKGQNDSVGDYTLDIRCGTPTCGDGILNPGEACDFGPDIPDDTCTASCEVEDTDAADDCAEVGAAISIPPGESHAPVAGLWFHNANSADDSKGSCQFFGENGGKDEVFAVVPEVSGTLTVATAVDFDNLPVCNTFLEPECWYSFLYVRGSDCLSGPELACNGINVNTGVNELALDVTAGETYHVFVDGLNDTYLGEGPYTLRFNLQ